MIQRTRGSTDLGEEIGWPRVNASLRQPTANRPRNVPKTVGDREDETSAGDGELTLNSRDLDWEVNLL